MGLKLQPDPIMSLWQLSLILFSSPFLMGQKYLSLRLLQNNAARYYSESRARPLHRLNLIFVGA